MPQQIIRFELNEPVILALDSINSLRVMSKFDKEEYLFATVDRKRFYAAPELKDTIARLGIKPGEAFGIRKFKQGRNVKWDVWLAPATEKQRATEEIAAQTVELATPAELKIALAPTGTEGPKFIPPLAPPSKPVRKEPIPFNVAFREVTAFVRQGLEATGEQWNDEARQGAVSTALIAAANAGWVGPWER